jgi:hypothetical protein
VEPDGDEVSFGGRERDSGWTAVPGWLAGSRRPWLAGLLVGAALLAAVAILVTGRGGEHRPPARPPVSVTDIGHRLLGITGGWELFGRGPERVVAIRFADGRITQTAILPLDSGGPVSFLVGLHEVIIRPIDFVPGYRVPDGQPPTGLSGPLDHGGPVISGPDLGHAWVTSASLAHPALSLVSLAGQPVLSVPLPRTAPLLLTATSDGNGNVLLTGPTGTYDAGIGGLHRLSLQPTAVGPHRWLAMSCRHRRQCRNVVVDPSGGALRILRTLPGPAVPAKIWPPGVISPDGSTAAVFLLGGMSRISLHLINLSTGADRPVAMPAGLLPAEQTLAWSPDGRWLFAVAAQGQLLAIDARTFRVVHLGVSLPYLTQIAVRAAPG